jgi:hypothetical protein
MPFLYNQEWAAPQPLSTLLWVVKALPAAVRLMRTKDLRICRPVQLIPVNPVAVDIITEWRVWSHAAEDIH